MRPQKFRTAVFAVLLFVVGGANAAVEDDWEAGKAAFAAGDYESALLFFRTAQDEGLDSPAVHYNMAVTQFRLGRYAEAGQTFQLIARRFPRMRALAEYNLGLVAQRQGQRDQAIVHFRQAYTLSGDDAKLRALAATQLPSSEEEFRETPGWSGVVGLRGGNDDNVALRDETGLPAGTTAESPIIDGFLSVSGPVTAGGRLNAEAGAYFVRYADADAFNQSELRGGLAYEWHLSGWRAELGALVSTSRLGGDAFDRKAGFRGRLVRQLTPATVVDLRYQYDDIADANPIYAGIDGSRQRLDLRYRWKLDKHRIQLRYQHESNDRQDPGVSPRRNNLGIEYRNVPSAGFGFEIGVERRRSDYNELAAPRSEDLTNVRGALTCAFPSGWLAQFEVLHSNNDSSDASFTYGRNRVTLGAIYIF